MNVRTTRLTLSHPLSHTERHAMATQDIRFKLNTGAEIPAVGFGTWQDAEAQEAAVLAALKAGYRHIDTARM